MVDTINRGPRTPDEPAIGTIEVTPSDASDLAAMSRSLYVGTTGDVKVTMSNDDVATFTSVPAGALLPIQAKRVWSTGTTASNIVALT